MSRIEKRNVSGLNLHLKGSNSTPLKTVIVAPMTSRGFDFPTRIPCTFQGKNGFILLGQIRAVHKSRLVRRLGAVSNNGQAQTVDCLHEMFVF
ncbi:MAG: type II toxin-antitoxin system PemK/MazF family toxin [Deltaproteobacteria bacterium]|nr:type II toxin-antitoxin system PemK/MazF family toxin [Deltaproteobacteria bacterium]